RGATGGDGGEQGGAPAYRASVEGIRALRTPPSEIGPAGLVVESHQVVCRDDPSDRRSAADTRVRPMPVVVMQPRAKGHATLVGMAIEPRIGPLEQGGLDEALDLAVCPRRIAPRPQVTYAEAATSGSKAVGLVARAIVGHHRGDANAQPAQAAHGAVQEADGGAAALVGQHLTESEAGRVVDGHVRELPAGA